MRCEIRPVVVKDHYEVVSELMQGLHDSEREMFNKAALWDDIKETYMEHVIEAQEDYNGTFLIAYIDDEPAGFIFGYAEEQDNSRMEEYTGLELYISDGYVRPAYRNKGVYHQLNQAIEQIYIEKSVRRINRFTLVTNKRMQNFLEKEGYVVTRLLYEKWLDTEGNATPLLLQPPK